MLSKGEAAALLSLINAHHGNAQWDDVQLDAFHSELRSDITAAEAREAVRRFYADNSTGRWCGSGDINGIVRKLRNGANTIGVELGQGTAHNVKMANPAVGRTNSFAWWNSSAVGSGIRRRADKRPAASALRSADQPGTACGSPRSQPNSARTGSGVPVASCASASSES